MLLPPIHLNTARLRGFRHYTPAQVKRLRIHFREKMVIGIPPLRHVPPGLIQRMPRFDTQCICELLAILTDTQFVQVQNSAIRLSATQFGTVQYCTVSYCTVRPADTTSPYLKGTRTGTEQEHSLLNLHVCTVHQQY